MRVGYLDVPDHLLKDVTRKLGTAIWGARGTALADNDQDNEG